MNKTRLSIIVPIYNSERYIEECVNSITAQTYEDKEIILVDDGSIDGTATICQEIISKCQSLNIRYIKKANGGAISARKSGLSVASGEYVTFVDSDDWVDNDYYAILMDCALAERADIVIGDNCVENEKTTQFVRQGFAYGVYDRQRLEQEVFPNLAFVEWGRLGFSPSQCTKVIKKSIIEKYQNDLDERILGGDDAVVTYPSFLEAQKIVYVESKALYHYRVHLGSMTHNRRKVDISERIALLEGLYDGFRKSEIMFADRTLGLYSLYVMYGVINRAIAEGMPENEIYDICNRLRGTGNWESIMKLTEKFPYMVENMYRFICQPTSMRFKRVCIEVKANKISNTIKKMIKSVASLQ